MERDHPSLPYFIKKRIITDNLYGVDIMEEAVEIAKLRLFLTLVSSAQTADDLEPLPNVDFNIMVGNSLIGLIRVDEEGFDQIRQKVKGKGKKGEKQEEVLQGNLLQPLVASEYRSILAEKNRSIAMYKEHSFQPGQVEGTRQDYRLQSLRNHIDTVNRESQAKLNQLLLGEFQNLKIQYEQAQLTGKAKKRALTLADMEALKPFHWGYHFDRVIERGGFDAIITNPPWEIFKPIDKEFCKRFDPSIERRKTDLNELNSKLKELLKIPEILHKYLDYQSQFPHVNLYYRLSTQYKNQISIVNDTKVKADINLYKLFLEQCVTLLRDGGECGIVLPSGIYSDLGSTQLRKLLFSKTQITGLFCFENRRNIFESVDSRFKFVILTFEQGKITESFPAAFMQSETANLESFPSQDSLILKVNLIQRLSPDSLSVMELKSKIEIEISEKMLRVPLVGETISDKWNIILGREFHMTDDRDLFKNPSEKHQIPLYEGKMIHHFTHNVMDSKYWINEQEGRSRLLKKIQDIKQVLDYQFYRFAYRSITSSTNHRTMICSIVPKNVFCGNSLNVSKRGGLSIRNNEILCFTAIMSSFVLDFALRQRVATQLNIFFVYQTPVPRLVEGDRYFSEIVDRAAKLICTTPEFDDLAAEVGLGSHANGATDEADRAKLRAELDGMIAHLYDLTEEEFQHILSTFPIVPAETKQAALEAYRTFTPTIGDQEILTLIAKGEGGQLEFKSTARWNLEQNKKDRTMEEVILKTAAAFLNADGGTLLIGVADNGTILGLQSDYKTLQKKNRDGFELWLMNDLLLKELGKEIAPFISVSFHVVDRQEVCRVCLKPAPQPVYISIRNKSGQLEEDCLFIRTGNLTSKLDTAKAIANYTKTRWG